MFSFLTAPHYPSAAVGVEDDRISAISLSRRGGGRFAVKQASSITIEPGIVTPSFAGVNIPDLNTFAQALENAVSSAGMLGNKRWSVSLPANSARTTMVTFETVPAKAAEFNEILDWKAEQAFGAPAEDMRLTWRKISNDREGRARYFVSAVLIDTMDEFETVFERFGWSVGLILPRVLCEANWLMNRRSTRDAMLLSAQDDGFTALVMRGDEPAVIRNVSCSESEIDDEIYRLLMFYNDRFGDDGDLQNVLVVGPDSLRAKTGEVAEDALGREIHILGPDEVGLELPSGGFPFYAMAAPAGLAALA